MRQSLAGLIYALSGALGVFAFLAPFLLPSIGEESMQGQLAPLLTATLVGLSVRALPLWARWLAGHRCRWPNSPCWSPICW